MNYILVISGEIGYTLVVRQMLGYTVKLSLVVFLLGKNCYLPSYGQLKIEEVFNYVSRQKFKL